MPPGGHFPARAAARRTPSRLTCWCVFLRARPGGRHTRRRVRSALLLLLRHRESGSRGSRL